MADPDDIIDPNDLDSIDALLDEAELDAGDLEDIEPKLPAEVPAEEEVAPPAEEPLTAVEDELISEDPELQELEEETNAPPTAQEATENVAGVDDVAAVAAGAVAGAAAATALAKDEPSEKAVEEPKKEEDDFEKVLQERQKKNQESGFTVEQMDSLKKIIIIFGASIIVLVLTAIGIGVWGALSASNSHLPEEAQTMLETIKVNGDLNISEVQGMAENLQSIEKKLDAVNFQVEQLAADLIKLQGSNPAQQVTIDPLGLNNTATSAPKESEVVQQQPPVQVAQSAPVVMNAAAAIDPQVIKKIDSINYRLIKAQKAIDTISGRVKTIQQTQQEVIHGVKSVEKQQLLEMKLRAEEEEQKAEEEKVQQDQNPYSYQTPDGMFYDQSVKDSYP